MHSISKPYVYTDLPQPLDDIEIKEDEEGFKIRLNQTGYLQHKFGDNPTSGYGIDNLGNNNCSYQDRELCKQPVLLLERCDDDIEVVDARRGKFKKRSRKTSNSPDMSSGPPKRGDNIFDIMWLADDAVERSKTRKTSISVVHVKEEQCEVVSDTDEKTQISESFNVNGSIRKDTYGSFSEPAQISVGSTGFVPGISDLNRQETRNWQGPPLGATMEEISARNSSALLGTPYTITEIIPRDDVPPSEEDSPNEPVISPREDEPSSDNYDLSGFALTKYDLIKMRRAQMKSKGSNKTYVVNNERRNIKGKGKQTGQSSRKVSSDYDADEEADDEDSTDSYFDDDTSNDDSDNTEIYSPYDDNADSSSSNESEGGNLECPKCDARFRDVSKLKAHMLSHFSEKSYQCKVCMRAFTSNTSLKKHVKVHDRTDLWRCRKCKKGFPTYKQLEMHSVRVHPGFKRFKCNICNEKFTKKAGYEIHVMKHINNNVQQSSANNDDEPQTKEDVLEHEIVTKQDVTQANQKSKKVTEEGKKAESKKTDGNRKEGKLTSSNHGTTSKAVKLPHTKLNMTSTKADNQSQPKSPHSDKSNQAVKPSTHTKANNNKAQPVDKMPTQKTPVTRNNESAQNLESIENSTNSITSKPPLVHKPSAREIGRKVIPNQKFPSTQTQSSTNPKTNNQGISNTHARLNQQQNINGQRSKEFKTTGLKIQPTESNSETNLRHESTNFTTKKPPEPKKLNSAAGNQQTRKFARKNTNSPVNVQAQSMKTPSDPSTNIKKSTMITQKDRAPVLGSNTDSKKKESQSVEIPNGTGKESATTNNKQWTGSTQRVLETDLKSKVHCTKIETNGFRKDGMTYKESRISVDIPATGNKDKESEPLSNSAAKDNSVPSSVTSEMNNTNLKTVSQSQEYEREQFVPNSLPQYNKSQQAQSDKPKSARKDGMPIEVVNRTDKITSTKKSGLIQGTSKENIVTNDKQTGPPKSVRTIGGSQSIIQVEVHHFPKSPASAKLDPSKPNTKKENKPQRSSKITEQNSDAQGKTSRNLSNLILVPQGSSLDSSEDQNITKKRNIGEHTVDHSVPCSRSDNRSDKQYRKNENVQQISQTEGTFTNRHQHALVPKDTVAGITVKKNLDTHVTFTKQVIKGSLTSTANQQVLTNATVTRNSTNATVTRNSEQQIPAAKDAKDASDSKNEDQPPPKLTANKRIDELDALTHTKGALVDQQDPSTNGKSTATVVAERHAISSKTVVTGDVDQHPVSNVPVDYTPVHGVSKNNFGGHAIGEKVTTAKGQNGFPVKTEVATNPRCITKSADQKSSSTADETDENAVESKALVTVNEEQQSLSADLKNVTAEVSKRKFMENNTMTDRPVKKNLEHSESTRDDCTGKRYAAEQVPTTVGIPTDATNNGQTIKDASDAKVNKTITGKNPEVKDNAIHAVPKAETDQLASNIVGITNEEAETVNRFGSKRNTNITTSKTEQFLSSGGVHPTQSCGEVEKKNVVDRKREVDSTKQCTLLEADNCTYLCVNEAISDNKVGQSSSPNAKISETEKYKSRQLPDKDSSEVNTQSCNIDNSTRENIKSEKKSDESDKERENRDSQQLQQNPNDNLSVASPVAPEFKLAGKETDAQTRPSVDVQIKGPETVSEIPLPDSEPKYNHDDSSLLQHAGNQEDTPSDDIKLPDNVLKVAKLLTGVDSKGGKLADVIKELIYNAPKEEKAEISKILREQGLSEGANESESDSKTTSFVKAFEAKTYNSCNFFYNSNSLTTKNYSRFSPQMRQYRRRSRSRSKSRDRHSRRSRSRDRHFKDDKDKKRPLPSSGSKEIVRYSPTRERRRPRSPSSRDKRSKTPTRRDRRSRSRTPDHRRHAHTFRRSVSPFRRHFQSENRRMRSRSRSPILRRRNSRSPSRKALGWGISCDWRKSVSPRRNSRSKDIQRYSHENRDTSRRSSRERDRARRSSERGRARRSPERDRARRSSERDRTRRSPERGRARRSSERDRARRSSERDRARRSSERDRARRSSERDWARRSSPGRDRDRDRTSRSSHSTDKSVSSNHGRDQHSRRSTHSRERDKNRDSHSRTPVHSDHKDGRSRRSTSSRDRDRGKDRQSPNNTGRSPTYQDWSMDNRSKRRHSSTERDATRDKYQMGSTHNKDERPVFTDSSSIKSPENRDNKLPSDKQKHDFGAIFTDLDKTTEVENKPSHKRGGERLTSDMLVIDVKKEASDSGKGSKVFLQKKEESEHSRTHLSLKSTDPTGSENDLPWTKDYVDKISMNTASNKSVNKTMKELSSKKAESSESSKSVKTIDSTEDATELVKATESTEEQWKRSWYQKVDNKKLILDTMENDSHGKNHLEQKRAMSFGEQSKQKSFLHAETTDTSDDVFLHSTATECKSSDGGTTVQSPKSRWDRTSPDLTKRNYIGKSLTIPQTGKHEENYMKGKKLVLGDKFSSPNGNSETSSMSNVDTTWKVKPQTTVIESTSLFKDNKTVSSKPSYADFKVTIQNTAQFISVMESPASPDQEPTSVKKGPRSLPPSSTNKNAHPNVQPRPYDGRNRQGENKPTIGEKIGVKVIPSKRIADSANLESVKAMGMEIRSNTSTDTLPVHKLKTKYSDNNNRPTSETEMTTKLGNNWNRTKESKDIRTDTKIHNKQSADTVDHFNKTLQELHSTLKKLATGTAHDTKGSNQTKLNSPPQGIVKPKDDNGNNAQLRATSGKLSDPRIFRVAVRPQDFTTSERSSLTNDSTDKSSDGVSSHVDDLHHRDTRSKVPEYGTRKWFDRISNKEDETLHAAVNIELHQATKTNNKQSESSVLPSTDSTETVSKKASEGHTRSSSLNTQDTAGKSEKQNVTTPEKVPACKEQSTNTSTTDTNDGGSETYNSKAPSPEKQPENRKDPTEENKTTSSSVRPVDSKLVTKELEKKSRKISESSSTSNHSDKSHLDYPNEFKEEFLKKTDTSEDTRTCDIQRHDNRTTTKRKHSSGGSSSTSNHDDKDVSERKKQHSNDMVKKGSAHKDKESTSFYLASQEPYQSQQTYDKESGTWRSHTSNSKRYWTKHPPHEGNHSDQEHNSVVTDPSDRKESPTRRLAVTDRDRETPFRCKDCNMGFRSYFELDVHKVLAHGHGDKKVYMCQICHQGFRYHAELDRHKLNEHKKNYPFKCLDCSDSFTTEERLKYHMYRMHGGPKSYEYSDFSDVRSNPPYMKRRARDDHPHSVEAKLYRLAGESAYTSTEKEKPPSPEFSCTKCSQIFTTARNLRNHMYARHWKRPWTNRPTFGLKRPSFHSDYYKATEIYRRRRQSCQSNEAEKHGGVSSTRHENSFKKPGYSPHRLDGPSHSREMFPESIQDGTETLSEIPMPLDANKEIETDDSITIGKDTAEEELFNCALCDETCQTKEEFSAHLKTHLNRNNSEENTETSSPPIIQKETRERNVPELSDELKKRQCEICDKILATQWSKLRHMHLHTGEKPFKCTVEGCPKSYVQKSDLTSHMRVHTEPERCLRCSWCPLTFKYEVNYQSHMKSHSNTSTEISGALRCNLCPRVLTSSTAMKKHKKKMHSNFVHQGTTLSNGATGKEYQGGLLKKICPQCGVKFLNEQKYNEHLLTHKGVNPYRCTIAQCQRSFGSDHALKRHTQNVHAHQETTKLKRICKECGAMFLTQKAFENHQLLHLGENPYKCTTDDCEKLFADASALKRHQNHAHTYSTVADAVRGSRLNCNVCGSIFYNSTLYEQHMITHGNSIYTCPSIECIRTFEDINGLQEHLKATQGHDSGIIWKDCRQCNGKFLTQHQMDKHREKAHFKPLNFKCTEPGCTLSYANLFGLKRHWRNVHERPVSDGREPSRGDNSSERQGHDNNATADEDCDDRYEVRRQRSKKSSCVTCGRSFATARAMKIHHHRAHAKKTHSCKLCSMVFTRSDTLLIHMNRHNNSNPYKCQICKKTFLLRTERDKHRVKEHSSEMSLGCPKCSRKFFDTKALRIHLFQTHNIRITATIVDNERQEHSKKTEKQNQNTKDTEEEPMTDN